MTRIAIIVSHPIQHFCPQYVSFAKNQYVELKVFFASALGHKNYIDKGFGQEISWNNLNLDGFKHQFLNKSEVLPPLSGLDAPELDAELDCFSPHVVFVYGYFQKIQRRAYAWAVRNKRQIAYISDSEQRQKRHFIKQLIKYFWIRNYFSNINYFLTVGDENEAYYRSFGVGDERFIRMHFPIDVVQYEQCYQHKEELNMTIRERYSIGKGEPIISVVGKLVSWKSQDHLIEVVKKFDGEAKTLHLMILGSGPMMDVWKNKAKGLKHCRVIMPGFISVSDLPAYYASSDVYVHPASVEPHSLAISEAIYMGCPVIISDRCGSYGNDDDVQDGKNGFVYPFGDLVILKQKIEQIINDQKTKASFGLYSRQIAKKFQQRAHVTSLMELQRLIAAEKFVSPKTFNKEV